MMGRLLANSNASVSLSAQRLRSSNVATAACRDSCFRTPPNYARLCRLYISVPRRMPESELGRPWPRPCALSRLDSKSTFLLGFSWRWSPQHHRLKRRSMTPAAGLLWVSANAGLPQTFQLRSLRKRFHGTKTTGHCDSQDPPRQQARQKCHPIRLREPAYALVFAATGRSSPSSSFA